MKEISNLSDAFTVLVIFDKKYVNVLYCFLWQILLKLAQNVKNSQNEIPPCCFIHKMNTIKDNYVFTIFETF
jgi:hypothetical protein